MKKLVVFSFLAAALAMFVACGGKQQAATTPAEELDVEVVVAEEAVAYEVAEDAEDASYDAEDEDAE